MKTIRAPAAISVSQVARSAADGYTILVASSSYVVNPSLYAKNPYDPFKDFAPVSLAAASPNILLVHPSLAAKTVKELIALLQANPGKYAVANPGLGTTPQLASELFKLNFKLDQPHRAFAMRVFFTHSRRAGSDEDRGLFPRARQPKLGSVAMVPVKRAARHAFPKLGANQTFRGGGLKGAHYHHLPTPDLTTSVCYRFSRYDALSLGGGNEAAVQSRRQTS